MDRTYEETAALLRALSTLTPAQSNHQLFEEWCRKAPPRCPEYPEGLNFVHTTTFNHAVGNIARFIRHLEGPLKGRHFVHFTRDDADDWFAIQDARLARGELRSYRGTQTVGTDLRRFYEWLRVRKQLLPQGNPWDDALSAFNHRHRNDVLDDYRILARWETTDLLGSAGARDFVGLLSSVKMLLRATELTRIEDPDVFLEERFVALREHPKRKGPVHQGLSRKLRNKQSEGYYLYPIDEELGRVLDWWYAEGKWEYSDHPYLLPAEHGKPGEPMTYHGWYDALKAVVLRSNVVVADWSDPLDAITTHTARRTGNSEMEKLSRGLDPLKLASLRGDSLKGKAGSKAPYIKWFENDLRPYVEEFTPDYGADKILRDLQRQESIDEQVRSLRGGPLARRVA